MKSTSSILRNAKGSCPENLRPGLFGLVFAAVALLTCFGANRASAGGPPVIDGNLNDMISFAQSLEKGHAGCGMYITDKPTTGGAPTPETIYNDLKFIPCSQPQPALGTHWVNGVEIFWHVLAYTPGTTSLYLGIRAEGMIGDGDGNDNPDNSGGGTCNPKDNISDTIGISGNELYAWNFDLDCDGATDGRILIQDNVVVGSGTLAGATGTFAFRQNGATGATGHDLEVQVTLAAPLPGAFNYVNVEANAFDGLSEDRSAGGVCIGVPAIDVSKAALPTSICPGGTTRFTVTIQNTGQTELSVVAKDQLPAGLTYAGNLNSTCGVGAPTNVGGLLTFPAVTILAGATCTISYDATAGEQCLGEVSNTVSVTGTFSSACIDKGGKQTVKDSATSTVTCRPRSSLELTADGPDSACPGAPVTISGTARNTGQEANNITVLVNGAQAYNQSVAAGQTINWSSSVNMPAECVAGQNTNFNVSATIDGECNDSTLTVQVPVRCQAPPCINLKVSRDLNAACPGDSIAFTGSVASCSADSQFVTLTINGVEVRTSPLLGNGTYNFSFRSVMPQCTAGNAVQFTVVATASNPCGTPQTKTEVLTVDCNSAPCVEVTASGNKQSGCPNEEVVISGQVNNCGTQAATYTVTVGGVQAFTGLIQPGGNAQYSRNVTLGNCASGATVVFPVVATVQNSCGNAEDTTSVHVLCNTAPCVELTANRVPDTACPGDAVTLSGTVKNCSTASETIVVTVNGEQVFNQPVAAGETQNWTKSTTMPACTAGNAVNWTVVATATGACPPVATQTATLSVQCNSKPCIDLIGLGATKSVACPAESLTVYGTVKNCGAQSGNYVVTIGGVQAFSGSLEAGASTFFSRSVNLTQCVAGASVDYAVHATVSNSCGEGVDDGTVSVRCNDKPCVELTAGGPKASCANNTITISGTVKNCGSIAATYVVKVGDTQAYNQSVAAGQTANWTLQVPFSGCTAGQLVHYTVTAAASNDCGTSDATRQVDVLCQAPPCVAIDLNAPTVACVGSTIQLCGTVTNCSNTTEDIEVQYTGAQSQRFEDVAPGTSKSFCFEIRMAACTQGDVRQWTVNAIATNDCGTVQKTAQDETKCKQPEIKVKKAAESLVNDGGIIHYTIIVENPGEAPLQNVLVSDPLCPYTVYNNHANPKPFSEPAVGSNGTVTWKIPLLAAGESMAFTFEAKASLATGGASCPGDVICRNVVTASGTCSGTTDTTPVTATDETATTIRCAAENCPRTVGFWTQQCAQKSGGSTKFTLPQLDQITAKVGDVSTFFNWTADSTVANFCAIINPPKPMDQRNQALRQFAALLANYATDQLNLTPNNGAALLLDPNTPISCGGFTASTIGQLITEVDLKLVTLAGQNLGDAEVVAKYTAIISCVDAINNGVGIPTTAACEHGDGDGGEDSRTGGAKLSAATPNPFSSTTQFSYEVSGDDQEVSVTVYNVAGRQVRTLVQANQPAGRYNVTWDGKADDGSSVVRGVYFVRAIVAGQKAPVQRVLYIRNEQ